MPVLVASQNEDFRHLLREMLEKSGFFHILEASSESEITSFFKNHQEYSFSLIHQSVMNPALVQLLKKSKKFLVIAQSENESLLNWTAQLGVDRFLSFPFSSTRLLEKINRILQ